MHRVALALPLFLLATASACASSNQASGSIGPSGGMVTLEGVTVQVPPGALSTTVTITVRRSDESPPAGWHALSPVYRFEPAGITFAAPVTITMPFTGSGARAQLVWTNVGETGWSGVGGTVTGHLLVGRVMHFSGGEVGEPEEDMGTPEEDGGTPDDLAMDLGTGDDGAPPDDLAVDLGDDGPGADLGSAPVCPAPQVIPAGGATSITWTRGTFGPTSCATTMCPDEGGALHMGGYNALVTVVERSSIVFQNSSRTGFTGICTEQVLGDCSLGDSTCFGGPMHGCFGGALVDPGTYTLRACGDPQELFIAPPVPELPNTSCATATDWGTIRRPPLGGTPTHGGTPAIGPPGTGPYYYTFSLPAGEGVDILVWEGALWAGDLGYSVQTTCGDSATEIWSGTGYSDRRLGDLPAATTVNASVFAAHPSATYTLVVTKPPFIGFSLDAIQNP